jgi:hypothetical protein
VNLVEDFGTSLEGEVYQLNLASKSLFGDGTADNTHTFENYTKYLANNGKSLDYVVTTLSFNENNDNQSILFTPARFINKDQYAVTSEVAKKPEVQKMVTMTPYQADMSGRTPALAAPVPKAAAAAVAEPVKRESTKAATPTPTVKKGLDDVVKAWSGEE